MPTTPAHTDATGFLKDLVDRHDKAWLAALAERAVQTGDEEIPDGDLDGVIVLLRDDVAAPRRPMAAVAPTAPVTGPTLGHVEWLGGFDNFKLLPDTLRLQPDRKVTIVFGKNGSGKTSLCDAIKALAVPMEQERPLGNVRRPGASSPSFEVKMAGEPHSRRWVSGRDALGAMSGSITYFDTAVAARNIRVPVAPERIVSLAPFRLGVFDVLRAYIGKLGTELKARHTAADGAKRTVLTRLQATLGNFPGSPFRNAALATREDIEVAIRDAGGFSGADVVAAKRREVVDLGRACSPDGINALKGEIRDLERISQAAKRLAGEIGTLWAMQPGAKAIRLRAVTQERQTLAASIVPSGIDAQAFLDLIGAAGHVCDLGGASSPNPCPLCRQPIDDAGATLFHAYRRVLDDALEAERKTLVGVLEKAKRVADAIPAFVPGDLPSMAIDEALRIKTVAAVGAVVVHAKADSDPTPSAQACLTELTAVVTALVDAMAAKRAALTATESGAAEPLRKLEVAKQQLQRLEYVALLVAAMGDLQAASTAMVDEEWLRRVIPSMRTVSTQVSTARRDAHTSLVLDSFNDRLDQEYRRLSKKTMAHYGAVVMPKTTNRGEDAEIAMDTLVGPAGGQAQQFCALFTVMSEGEQRMHALALFFAELECSSHPVIVFDDPVSSFDFDHIENYCIRLRDFVTSHPNRQVIVLTHNWEFFVRLQDKLDIHNPSIQVLEQCSVVSSYVEKVDALSREIRGVLGATGVLTDGDKRKVSGALRLLIEVVVNKTVFNDLRHRYRQPNQTVSVFRGYMKLVPLEPPEATRFADLYSILSQSEHDDPRNNILSIDRPTFQAHFDDILRIETDLKARKSLRP